LDVLAAVLAFVCALSLAGNGALYYLLRKSRRKPPPVPSLEASEILNDLTTKGSALVKVTRVDASNLFVFGRTHG
jgi:hypothetical protein